MTSKENVAIGRKGNRAGNLQYKELSSSSLKGQVSGSDNAYGKWLDKKLTFVLKATYKENGHFFKIANFFSNTVLDRNSAGSRQSFLPLMLPRGYTGNYVIT